MARSWSQGESWATQIPIFHRNVKRWNKEVFGDIFLKKNSLINKLEVLDNQIANHPSANLDDERRRLWHEYEKVLFQEELMWYQKSRSKWLFYGDRNTKYFHGVTTIRRRNNSYEMLQDENGNWIGDRQQLEEMVTSFYRNLFSDDGLNLPAPITGAFPTLSESTLRFLEREVTHRDILNVVNHMNPFKAPGVDGLLSKSMACHWRYGLQAHHGYLQ